MEHILSRLMMDAEGGGLQRQAMKDVITARENLASNDEARVTTGLLELCDLLNMATPITIGSIRPNVFVPLVVNCMKKDNIDLVILAARALTYMVDAISSTVFVLVSEGGIDVLLQHFQEVKDIELSEQCLTCVEKITQNSVCAATVLQSMGVPALLMYVDFFNAASQRKAWTSVAAMCRRVNESNFGCVECSLQDISARIDHDDAKISEKAITCLYRIISGVGSNPELVARAFGDSCNPLISVLSRQDLSETTFTTALSLIACAIDCSTEAARRTLESGIVEYMFTLIASSSEQQQRQDLAGFAGRTDGVSRASAAREPSTQRESVETVPQRDRRLSVEQTKALCLALTALLPKLNKGYLVHGDALNKLIAEGHGESHRHAGASFSEADEGMGGDDDEDGDGDMDDDDDDDEEEEEECTHEEILSRVSERGILLENNEKYRTCRLRHMCDGCGKSCIPTSWFRCNKCRDYDLCGRCLLMNWDSHSPDGETHSFCDMLVFFPKVSDSVTPEEGKESNNSDLTAERERLYESNPHLLALILGGIPTVVALFNESEAHLVRNHCLAFIDRAVVLATPEQLAGIKGLSEAALCEMIVTAMVDSSLILNVQVMYLCRMLLEKLPKVYLPCFVHEGVTNSLVKIQEQNKSFVHCSEEPTPVKEPPSSERFNSVSGWRELLATEAEEMLGMFTSLSDDTRILRLKEVDRLLRGGKLKEAFDSLRVALLDETTAFELSATDVLHSLVEALKSVDDVKAIVALLKTLAKQEPNTTSTLTRFVRLLQTALSHLDQFQLPNFGAVNTIQTQIPLRLVPHVAGHAPKPKASTPPAKGNASKRVASGSTAGPPVPTREVVTRRPTGTSAARPAAVTSRNKKDQSASPASTNTGGGKSSVENREVRVSVEPLTNLEALMGFVGSNVLSGGGEFIGSPVTGGGRRRNDDDEVEEVLPELANGVDPEGLPKKKKPVQEKSCRPVYMRCGKYVLPPSLTILQLLQRYHTPSQSSSRKRKAHSKGASASLRLLALLEGMQTNVGDMITLHYSVDPFGPEYVHVPALIDVPLGTPAHPVEIKLPSDDITPPGAFEVMRALHNEYPFSSQFLTVAQKDILTLLGILHAALRNWSALISSTAEATTSGGVSDEASAPSTSLGEFIHGKLNNKAMRHCSNLLLAGQHMTTWAVNLALDCNFLFSSMTRKYLFDVGFCGSIRSLVQMQENMEKYGMRDTLNADHQFVRSYRLQREKKRVWRDKALACAMHIMGKERISGSVVLEFEYYNENGSGSGPTMEFYTLVSDELRETKLRLWRRTDETPDDKYYRPHVGVYPRPIPPSSPELDDMERYFSLLGRLIARALLDKRILSIPLSPVLLKMLRGDPCGVHDLADISESLGASVLAIARAARRGDGAVQMPNSTVMCSVEDLGLDFTLPGDEFVELTEGGASIPVTKVNAMEYCDAVTEFVLRRGVERFVHALRTGFHDYVPLYALRMLSIGELFEVLNGHPARVTVEELDANCQADHGYTMGCRHVRQLFEIIASLTEKEQSAFFHFLTGSAHLPAGGLASLRPKFTIVRKASSDPNVREQDQLPSAMTCQNYLKLPAYDTKQQMEEKLKIAINEGCGEFLLT